MDNVRDHSKASTLEITTFQEDDILTIVVEDNGQGGFKFPEEAGVGVTSVIKRIESLNGQLVVDTNRKTKCTLKIPLENA